MTTIYLVRHGETFGNVSKIMQGQRQGELTPAGIAQIEDLAISLYDIHFDAIVSSDLKRAFNSSKILASHFQLPTQTTTLLRERDWGDYTGRYIPDLKGLPMPHNVETMDRLLSRAKQFIDWTLGNYQDKVIISVGHGIINKAIQAVHYDKLTREIQKMHNAEFRILHL